MCTVTKRHIALHKLMLLCAADAATDASVHAPAVLELLVLKLSVKFSTPCPKLVAHAV